MRFKSYTFLWGITVLLAFKLCLFDFLGKVAASERPPHDINKDIIVKDRDSRELLYNDGIRQDLAESDVLSSLLFDKSLDMFELTDLVLTSDVEGNLNAINRKTGEVMWSLASGSSIVSIASEEDDNMAGIISTSHFSSSPTTPVSIVGNKINDFLNTTSVINGRFIEEKNQGSQYRNKEKLIWLVEPYGDGSIYQFTGDDGLQKLPVSIKQFIMNSPFSLNDDFVYTGSKHSGILKLNALNGAVIESYGVKLSRSVLNEKQNKKENDYELCDIENVIVEDNNKQEDISSSDPYITIGRTVYELTIHAKNNTSWNITYVQWGPNNLYSSLMTENEHSMDNLYIQPFHDNSILAMDSEERVVKWVANLPYTTINVFDVYQDSDDMNKLVLLPHPIDQASMTLRNVNVDSTFIDRTMKGSWFALSESHYPSLVRSAPFAKYITSKKWRSPSILLNNDLLVQSIKGVHDNSIKAKVDEKEPDEKDLALYHPTIFPTAIEQIPTKKYDLNNRKLPDSAKYYESRKHEEFNESYNGKPTSTYKLNSLKDFTIRTFENVIVALICFLIFYLLNRFEIIDFFNINKQQQQQQQQLQNPLSTGESSSEKEHTETEENIIEKSIKFEEEAKKESSKNVQISEVVEVMNGNDEEEIEIINDLDSDIKKKRKRGARGGKKHKKKDVESTENKLAENGQVDAEENKNVTKISNNLSITDEILGFGSHGTIVFKGYFENRPVAVKRMLVDFCDVASHEISLLQESDDHSNVIRYFCSQEHNKFLYIALELCSASLEDVIEKKRIDITFSPQQILWQIANGVYHLHSLKIVHRDIKPQNILVVLPKNGTGKARFLISDFGLCKRLDGEQSSFKGTTANAAGTSGWRAPELLIEASKKYTEVTSNVRLTRGLDIFSTGCVFYYILTGGKHPFGDRFIREGEIIKGQYNLEGVNDQKDSFEVKDLLTKMIARNPVERPDIVTVMKHPYFWSTERKMEFLLKISDRFEVERRDPPSPLLIRFESIALKVLGKDGWFCMFDQLFLDNLGKYRKYDTHKLMDLLRAVRNKYHHYQDMPAELLKAVGPLPEGFYWYFASKFPSMLLSIYEFARDLVEEEDQLRGYY